MGFVEIGVAENISKRLEGIGISEPTSIQQLAIPPALGGESILAKSQTGSGKTLAYLLPIFQRITQTKRALILVPTRELVQQIGEVCSKVCGEISFATIYGGVEYEPQIEVLATMPTIVISTVGRLLDLVNQGVANIESVDYFVLDEVDQMVDLGFRDDIVEIAKWRKQGAQTLCFSATIPSQVESVISEIMPLQYFRAENREESLAVERIEQSGYYVSLEMMDHLLLHLLRSNPPKRGIIFTRSRKMADRVSFLLRERGMVAEAIHSDRSQTAREHILSRFKCSQTTLLVATDVLARGIDVEDVDVVYNYGMPQEAEQYIHRIGRTARGGGSGKAISLSTPDEKVLIDRVCKLMRRPIIMSVSHPYSTPLVLKSLSTPHGGRSKKRDRKNCRKTK
ncbi:MAG: DEAD/DEAH box helicase [Rikenellaceae bacterium]